MADQNPVPNPPNPIPPPSGAPNPNANNPYRIITTALMNAGYLELGESPSSEQIAWCIPLLNDLFNGLQTQGLKLWLQEDVSIVLTEGVNLYSFGPAGTVTMPRPPRFLEGYWQDQWGNRRPLIVLSRNEWDYLSTLIQQGPVNSYFVDKQQLVTNLYLWLTPDAWSAANGNVHMLTQVQVNNMISLTDQLNFPIEWFLGLHWGLADMICTGQPASIMQRCQAKAAQYLAALQDWDVEDASTTFQPDQRTQYNGYNFR